MLKQLKVDELTPGMMVTQVIEQHGPVKIRKVGFIRSNDMIRGLTEMGVTLVEVDIGQSLNVESADELDEESSVNAGAANEVKTTVTQRLVVSDRQIADVDRQLSQQFHRSLFLPAVEHMPSKWMLYGKPYALLFVIIVAGILGGAMASYTAMGIINTKDTTITSQTNGANESTLQNVQAQTASSNLSEAIQSDNGKSEVTESQNEQAQNKIAPITQSAAAKEVQTSTQNEADSNALARNTEAANLAKPVAKPPAETVNGVALEAGQTVLGYQSGVDDDIQANTSNGNNNNNQTDNNTGTNTSRTANSNQGQNQSSGATGQNTSSGERLNSTLLRRIQAAADDVDSQMSSPEPELVKVTDFNTLPRIDQLSPAILTQMPAMSFSAHMYASNPRDRWVRVNSQRLGEGDTIANNVILKRIESEKVVLEYNGKEFTMNALSDW